MNYRKLSDTALVDLLKSVVEKLTAHEVTCLDNTISDDLAAMLAPITTAFNASCEQAIEFKTEKQAIYADKRSNRALAIEGLSVLQSYLRSTRGPEADYERCGFTYPSPPSTVVPNDPTDLAGAGSSNGVNSMTFTGNNKYGNVVYEMWRRHGDEGDWRIIGTTRKQSYTDTPVTPGQYYEYKVRAVASSGAVSNYSNSAVVYGTP